MAGGVRGAEGWWYVGHWSADNFAPNKVCPCCFFSQHRFASSLPPLQNSLPHHTATQLQTA
eukprot:21972-Chlamydomonas_euryale.AAC.5